MSKTKSKIFSFKKQLELGNKGEDLFIKEYGFWYGPKKGDGKTHDLILKDGAKVELKTDFYTLDKTQNFFMERFGSVEEQKIGGPWKALEDGNKYFIYCYYKNKAFFWFTTERLVNKLDSLIKKNKLKLKYINNQCWTTAGYLINRMDVMDTALKLDIF